MRAACARLAAEILARLPDLLEVVKENPDFAAYGPEHRELVADLIRLALAAYRLLRTPFLDEDGCWNLSDEAAEVVDDVMKLLAAMARRPYARRSAADVS